MKTMSEEMLRQLYMINEPLLIERWRMKDLLKTFKIK